MTPMNHQAKLNDQAITRREMLGGLGATLTALTAVGFRGATAFAQSPTLPPHQIGQAAELAQLARMPDRRFNKLRDRYFLKALELNPVTATYLGGDGYSVKLRNIDSQLRDYKPLPLKAETAFYNGILDELDQIAPASLSPDARVDQRVLYSQLRFILRELEERRTYERAVETYVIEAVNGVNYQLQQMQAFDGDLLGTEEEWLQVVRRVDRVPAYLRTARANLLAGKASGNLPDRRMVQLDGIEGSGAAAQFFGSDLLTMALKFLGPRRFAARTLARLYQAALAAAAAYRSFATFLGQTYDLNEQLDRFAIGIAEYEWKIKNNFGVTQTAAELYDYGAEQVAFYQNQMFDIAQQISVAGNLNLPFGTADEKRSSTRQVLNRLNGDAPASDDQLFAWYRQIAQQAVAYGRQVQLFNIPDDYQLEVVETPPVLQSGILAAYNPAPPFKAGAVGQFYVTPTGNDPAKLRESSRSFMTNIAVHEGFPGHDLHYKFMAAQGEQIANLRWLTPGAVQDTSSMWSDSMAAEGWAHYAEQLVAEASPGRPYGFYSQNDYLYFLQAALFRAVRVRVDVGLHTGRMGYDEAVDYFTANYSLYPNACALSSTDPAAGAVCALARREIYRYSKWPTQAITYNLGKRAILELREAYRAQTGAGYSAKIFHEKLMSQGTIAQGFYRDEFLNG